MSKDSQSDKIFFEFTEQNKTKARNIIMQYPKINKGSAVMPLLYLAQEQNDGWLSEDATIYVAEMLEMKHSKVLELIKFYTMYYEKKLGKYHIKICRTTPCCLCGSDKILEAATKNLGISINQTTVDGIFTITEVECLGACTEAPIAQINNEYHTKLNEKKIIEIIQAIQKNNAKT